MIDGVHVVKQHCPLLVVVSPSLLLSKPPPTALVNPPLAALVVGLVAVGVVVDVGLDVNALFICVTPTCCVVGTSLVVTAPQGVQVLTATHDVDDVPAPAPSVPSLVVPSPDDVSTG